jgi:hypothetical protein
MRSPTREELKIETESESDQEELCRKNQSFQQSEPDQEAHQIYSKNKLITKQVE